MKLLALRRCPRPHSVFLVGTVLIFFATNISATPLRGKHNVGSPIIVAPLSYQSNKLVTRQQTVFSAEEPIQSPIEVPTDVLRILQKDARNKTCLREGQSFKDIPSSWFVASGVEFKEARLHILIVMSANSCLNGANVIPFWIFRRTAGGHLLSLSTTAFALEILKTRTNSYPDIRLTSLSARTEYTSVYKFNGNKYRPRRRSQKPISQ
jgi:hypothetical protein